MNRIKELKAEINKIRRESTGFANILFETNDKNIREDMTKLILENEDKIIDLELDLYEERRKHLQETKNILRSVLQRGA